MGLNLESGSLVRVFGWRLDEAGPLASEYKLISSTTCSAPQRA